jgi:hypothetical protein
MAAQTVPGHPIFGEGQLIPPILAAKSRLEKQKPAALKAHLDVVLTEIELERRPLLVRKEHVSPFGPPATVSSVQERFSTAARGLSGWVVNLDTSPGCDEPLAQTTPE